MIIANFLLTIIAVCLIFIACSLGSIVNDNVKVYQIII